MDYDFPPDLLAAQRAYDQADAKVQGLVAGDDDEALKAAREERLRAVMELHRHEFWRSVDNRHQADMALKKAARS
ncbi:hypothetical protein JOL79_11160 [Microbispora sp. RL4-1S]|uniref:Uncharacterized protein n=1 Tax=Microbispora oryzae TaxID=2806554 RepID=A0A940WF75_9ACTN|nr:hypothetical protein [Microbispora oryzae]MBP2704371.1 hypothetical protein [Microbispora oryzae]